MSSLIGPLIPGNLFLRALIISAVSSTDSVVWVIYARGFLKLSTLRLSTSFLVSINLIDPFAD